MTTIKQPKTWCPAVELTEDGEALILKAELPGVRKKDVHVHATHDSLTITGERNQTESNQHKELIPSELHYGQLDCTVPLPVAIRCEQVCAELIDGVLTVTMPKQQHTQSETFAATSVSK